MNLLLDDAFAPITSEFGFVETDLETLADWWMDRQESIQRTQGVSFRCVNADGPLAQQLSRLLPLTSVERRRWLLIPTGSGWTAVFDNGWRGGDAAGLSLSAKKLGCRAVRVVAVPDGGGQCGARIFELYGPAETDFLNYQRTISVANDGGRWRLDRGGTPLPAEDSSWFASRMVKDRFRVEHLAALLGTFGLDAFNESFYRPIGKLIEKHGPPVKGSVEYDLAAAKSRSSPGKA
jgi:hypothetical protein